jgi:hypothetical protein
MRRHLLVTRRRIPLDRQDEYLAGWRDVRVAVLSNGGRAWIFRGADRQDQFMEFIEWSAVAGSEPLLECAEVASARETVDNSFGSGLVDEWEEAPPAP